MKLFTFGLFLLFSTGYGQVATIPQLRRQLTQAPHDTVRMRLYSELAGLYTKQKKNDSAYYFATEGIELARRYKMVVAESRLYLHLGNYYKRSSRYAKAREAFQTALQLGKNTGATPLQCKLLYRLACVYADEGAYHKTIETALASSRMAEQLHDTIQLISAYNMIALGHKEVNNRSVSLSYAQKMYQLAQWMAARHADQVETLLVAETTIAELYEANGQYALAYPYLKRSFTYFAARRDPIQMASSVVNLSSNLVKQNRPLEAIQHLNESFRRKFILPGTATNVYEMYALAYQQLGQFDTALGYARKAYAIARQKGHPKHMQSALSVIVSIEESQRSYPDALAHLRKLYTIHDSLFTVEKAKAVSQVEAQYQVTQKQHTIELLQKDAALRRITLERNQEEFQVQRRNQQFLVVVTVALLLLVLGLFIIYRREQTIRRLLATQKTDIEDKADQLQQANQLKDKLFGIIGHDLRSPLAALKIQLANMGNDPITPWRADARFVRVEQLADVVYNITDNLLNWSMLQRGGIRLRSTEFDLSWPTGLALDLFSSQLMNKQLAITTRFEPAMVRVDEYQLQIVVRNLLHNAIKFTPSGGSISLYAGQQQGRGVLQIADTGIGMSAEQLQRVQRSLPKTDTVSENSTGLGLEICREFVRLNQGLFTIRSEPGRGTTVRIEFDLVQPQQPVASTQT